MRASSDAESQNLAILQLDVEELDVLECLTFPTKAYMVLLLETHKENNNPFKIPGFTLAGHTNTPGRQHGIVAGIDWAGDLNWAASTRKKMGTNISKNVLPLKLSHLQLNYAFLLFSSIFGEIYCKLHFILKKNYYLRRRSEIPGKFVFLNKFEKVQI